MTWEAAGYIALSATVTWLIAFNTYYLALRLSSVGVVTPIMATDPVFTALFAVLILGASLTSLVLAGLMVATAGVALLSREGGEEPAVGPDAQVPTPGPASGPITLAAPARGSPGAHGTIRERLMVVALAIVTAAGWGLGPVFIEKAQRALAGNTPP